MEYRANPPARETFAATPGLTSVDRTTSARAAPSGWHGMRIAGGFDGPSKGIRVSQDWDAHPIYRMEPSTLSTAIRSPTPSLAEETTLRAARAQTLAEEFQIAAVVRSVAAHALTKSPRSPSKGDCFPTSGPIASKEHSLQEALREWSPVALQIGREVREVPAPVAPFERMYADTYPVRA